MSDGRDARGRFTTSGNPKGRPKERKEYMDILRSTLTPAQWRAICKKAIRQAKDGDKAARRWLSDYVIGKPLHRIEAEMDTRGEINVTYSDTLDRVYGNGTDGESGELSQEPG